MHLGEVASELCIELLGLTITEAAKALGVTRKTLPELLNGHSRIMGIRLSITFKTSAESWINHVVRLN